MYKKLLSLTLIAAALTACGDEQPEQKASKPVCSDPAVNQNVRTLIQDALKNKARDYARQDNRQYVDADKIIAAGSDLSIEISEAAPDGGENGTGCTAKLAVTVPFPVLELSHANAPLIYGTQDINAVLQRYTGDNKLAYNGNGLFNQTMRYKVAPEGGSAGVSLTDDLGNIADAVAAVLLPYGVKSHVVVDGRPVAREDALKQLKGEPVAQEAEPALLDNDPRNILDNNSASSVFGNPAETITPQDVEPDSAVAPEEVEQARKNHSAAESEINRVWNRMDQMVRKELVNDQREWINQKTNSCRQAAARAGDSAQAEYLQLQCSTRMTRERIQYLKGYSI